MNAALRWLRAINPFGLPGSGPWALFQKDVRASGRRKLTYWSRGLYALAFAGLVGIVLLAVISDASWQGPAASLQQMQRIAPILATTVLWFQFAGLVFAAPLLTGPALCEERRNRTLSALLTTPLTAGQIVLGKLMGALCQLVIFALVPVPVVLAVRIFGGLDAQAVLMGTAVALAAAILAGSWAMVFSLNAARGVNAAMSAWAVMVFCHGLVPVIAASPIGLPRLGIPVPAWFMPAFCPPMALFTVSERLTGFGPPGLPATAPWWSIGGSLGLSALLWLFATSSLRASLTRTGGEFQTRAELRREARALRKSAASPASTTGEPAPAAAADPTAADSGSPRRKRAVPRGHSRTIGDHPILWREVRQSVFGSRTRLVLAIVAVGAVLWTTYGLAGITDPEVHQAISVLSILIFAATSCVATTASIGAERDARTLGVLLTTPLSPRRIIWGKFAGGLSRLWPIPLAVAICLLIIAPIGGIFSPLPLLLYFGAYAAIGFFLCATGVFFSLIVRRVSLASVFNFLFAMGIWFIFPMMCNIFFEIAGGNQSGADVIGLLFSGNPVALGIIASSRLDSLMPAIPLGIRGNAMSNTSFELVELRFNPAEFTALCVGVWFAYGLVAVAVLEMASRRLAVVRSSLA